MPPAIRGGALKGGDHCDRWRKMTRRPRPEPGTRSRSASHSRATVPSTCATTGRRLSLH